MQIVAGWWCASPCRDRIAGDAVSSLPSCSRKHGIYHYLHRPQAAPAEATRLTQAKISIAVANNASARSARSPLASKQEHTLESRLQSSRRARLREILCGSCLFLLSVLRPCLWPDASCCCFAYLHGMGDVAASCVVYSLDVCGPTNSPATCSTLHGDNHVCLAVALHASARSFFTRRRW